MWHHFDIMSVKAPYRYPLRLDRKDKQSVDAVVRATGRTINQVLILSVRKGLPLAREALCPASERITNVEPIPDEVWRRIYSRKDELDEWTGDDLKSAQSQAEPQ
jgi:hypothetical protein